MPRVALHTFGCKINQYETQGMGEAFVRAGYALAVVGEAADWHLINTCTVTARSDRESLSLVRRIAREDPSARIAVAGCSAQRNPSAFARLPGVALVVGEGSKGRIAELAAGIDSGRASDRGSGARPGEPLVAVAPIADRPAFDETPVSLARTTRALVKVQDGCDGACGFCIIPSVRGASRSRPLGLILSEVQRLVESGCLEIVVTGVHLGSWRDPDSGARLDALVERLVSVRGLRRVRLSSLEPQHLTDRLLDLTASPALMPFFHLPLQSGDDATLRRMRRGYNTHQFAERVARLLARRPDVGIGTDLLVGFPGEDAASFERSLRFVEAMPFSRLHVFPFSPRPGTEAAEAADRVSPEEIRERAARMRGVGGSKERGFRSRFDGSRAEMLVEIKRTAEGLRAGYTENYLRAEIVDGVAAGDLANRIVAVRLRNDALADARSVLSAVPIAA